MMDWNIQSRAHHCQSCQQSFQDQQTYYTVLLDRRHSFERQDLCQTCWNTSQQATAQGCISHWHGIYVAPPAAPPDPIQKATAESLLRQLLERNDPTHAPACYILAAMLERKRILKVKSQTRQDGHRIFIYEHPASGDIFAIHDPDLQLHQLEAVQRDVSHLLLHGLEAPSIPTPTDAPPAVPTTPAPAEPASEPTPPPEPSPTPAA